MTMSYHELRQYSDRKIFITLGALMAVALVATVAFLFCLNNVLRLRQESIQITKIQSQLDAFYIQLLNAETGQRGYLLTGDASYLKPYQEAVKQIPQKGAQLDSAGRNYSYADKIHAAREVATNKMAELSTTLRLREREGSEAALARVQTGTGQEYMNNLRSLMSEITAQQTTDLAVKRERATSFGDWARWISVLMAAGVVALAGLVYFLFLKAIQSERALDRAKDDFVALASHQLRTPATGVKSILSVLRANDVGVLNDRQRHLVDRAIESTDREIRIVEELLNVARADAGRLVLKPIELDLRKLVEAAATAQRDTIEHKHQHLTLQLPDRPIHLVADPEKLHMAVSNLIDNASKYTSQNGGVTVSVHQQRNTAKIDVSDTGIGIDKAELAIIFDRFQRAHGVITGGTEGTGLGLYLARHIAELHNGVIEVKSKKGRGSTFTLKLPLEKHHHVT